MGCSSCGKKKAREVGRPADIKVNKQVDDIQKQVNAIQNQSQSQPQPMARRRRRR